MVESKNLPTNPVYLVLYKWILSFSQDDRKIYQIKYSMGPSTVAYGQTILYGLVRINALFNRSVGSKRIMFSNKMQMNSFCILWCTLSCLLAKDTSWYAHLSFSLKLLSSANNSA